MYTKIKEIRVWKAVWPFLMLVESLSYAAEARTGCVGSEV
jgi:hypothetical protein